MTKTKFFGPWACMMALLVASLTFTGLQRAYAVTSAPNEITVPYTVAVGDESPAIDAPASVPVMVMGDCTTQGDRGVGGMWIQRVPGNFMEWSGLNSTNSNSVTIPTSGFSSSTGTEMIQIDFSGDAVMQVASPGSFVVANPNSGGFGQTTSGSVTLIW